MPKRISTRGFTDSAKVAQPGAQRGAPAFGSPHSGIVRQDGYDDDGFDWLDSVDDSSDYSGGDGFDWLNSLGAFPENAGNIINAVKGNGQPKLATQLQKPPTAAAAAAQKNLLLVAAGIALLIVTLVLIKK